MIKSSKGLLLAALIAGTAQVHADDQDEKESYSYLGEFTIGYKYQEMEADTIRYAYVKTTGMNIVQFIWSPAEASWARERGWLAAILPSLSYETTPGDSAEQDTIAEVSESSKQGWKRFMGTFDIQPTTLFTDAETSAHHIDISLDVQTFLVTVQTTQDYFYVDDNDARLLTAGDQLDLSSTFTEAMLGYRWQAESLEGYNGIYSLGLGAFSVDYEKPISSDVATAIESIYKGTFSATGLYASLGTKVGSLQLDLRYDIASDATAEVDGGTSLSRTDYGYDASIEYNAWRATATYNLENFLFGLPLETRVNYVEREFSTLADGESLNDDRIIDLALTYKFSL